MQNIGIEVHKRESQICILTEQGAGGCGAARPGRTNELAPVNWKKTLENEDAQQRLAANVFRQASLGALVEHQPTK